MSCVYIYSYIHAYIHNIHTGSKMPMGSVEYDIDTEIPDNGN